APGTFDSLHLGITFQPGEHAVHVELTRAADPRISLPDQKGRGAMNLDQDGGTLAHTRLGRTVRATVAAAVATSSRHREPHRRTNWLRDVILGGQDGLVNILGIILGVIAGGGSKTVLVAAGFAAAITESISIGAV